MTFRTRILVACLMAAAVPLVVFAIGARNEVGGRLEAQFEQRVRAASAVVREDLAREAAAVDARLAALAARIADDADRRAALLQHVDRALLRDYAPSALQITGLDYLLLLDVDGTVLSSGHFRNDYGRIMPVLPALLRARGPVLLRARRPEGSFLALARAHAFTIGSRPFVLAGGAEIDSAFVRSLLRDAPGTLALTLAYPDGVLQSGGLAGGDAGYRERLVMPFLDDAASDAGGDATWTIRHSGAGLIAVRRGIDRWLLAAMAAAIVLALAVASLLAGRVNRPLEELARRSRRIDLDNPDVSLATRRYDEIGSLSRVLDAMLQRLRASAAELRAAERRATVGDMARQVNHDIRNGLMPIRNVVRHLSEVAQATPTELANVFSERAGTLQGAIGYLETLATNYARLAPAGERRPFDVNAIIRATLSEAAQPSGRAEDPAIRADRRLHLELSDAPLIVAADPVALRRVIENLAANAMESLANGNGSVTVRTEGVERSGARRVIVTVADTGHGIDPAELDRIFDDFYTTRERGSGLGLSIVRRLVADMGGAVRVESQPGRGTTFRIDLPEAQ